MEVYFLGRAPYRPTCQLQERLRARVQAGGPEALLLCEHPPILTLGRGATTGDILAEPQLLQAQGIDVERTSRGGQVTYHGPGQIVAYPIVRLRRGIVAHVEWLAQSAVELAARYGVVARYDRQQVGVFVGEQKLAAIGVHVSRRVTLHGMALNVTAEATRPFGQSWFVPCGNRQGQAISLEQAMGRSLSLTSAPAARSAPAVATDSGPPATVERVAEQLAAILLQRAGAPLCVAQRSSVALLSQSLFVE